MPTVVVKKQSWYGTEKQRTLLKAVSRRMPDGRLFSTTELAADLGLNMWQTLNCITGLVSHGFIVKCEKRDFRKSKPIDPNDPKSRSLGALKSGAVSNTWMITDLGLAAIRPPSLPSGDD